MLQNQARRLRQVFARHPAVRLLFALLVWVLTCAVALGVVAILLGVAAGLVTEPTLHAVWVLLGIVTLVVLATPSVGLGMALALVAILGLLSWLASDPAGVGSVLLLLFVAAAVGSQRFTTTKGGKA